MLNDSTIAMLVLGLSNIVLIALLLFFRSSGDKRAERMLHTSEERYRQLIGSLTEYAIYTSNRDGMITDWYSGAEHIEGYKSVEVIGQHYSMFFTEKDRTSDEPGRALQLALQEGKYEFSGNHVRKDGSHFWADILITPICDDAGTFKGFAHVTRDATERKRLDDELRRGSERLLSAQRMAHIGSAEFDPATGITVRSPEFFRILGLDENSPPVGPDPIMTFHPDDHDKVKNILAQMKAGQIVPSVDLRIIRPNGEVIWARRNQEIIYGPDERPERILTSFLDVTEQKHLEQQKDEFLSMITHELRTPLTSIRGALTLIASNVAGQIPSQAQQLVEIANRNGERLGRLIDDLLDVQRIQEGRMVYNDTRVAISSIVTEAVEAIQPFASRYHIDVKLRSNCPTAFIYADAQRIGQVMANLLSNAIKFSKPDNVVEVDVERRSPWLRITVQDHGMGIPESFRSRIFERFAQSEVNAREHGGSGLGLNIVTAIIAHHEGRISFESELGVGTKFYVDLKEIAPEDVGKMPSLTPAIAAPSIP